MLETAAILYVSKDSFRKSNASKVCNFLLDELTLLNFQVEKINFVNEIENWVANDLIFLSRQFDIVLVISELQNGVISNAFGRICSEELVMNPKLSVITNGCSETYNIKLLPSVAKLLADGCSYPIIYFQRIFIMKESFVEESFCQLLREHLHQYRILPKFSKKFIVQVESDELGSLQDIGNTNLISVTKEGVSTLTIEKSNFDDFVACEKNLKKELGDKIIEICDINMLELIYRSKEENIQQAIRNIEKCFDTYGPENVFLSFNGGKDCTVLLHLVYLVLKIKFSDFKQPIFCLYVRSHDVFPEQDNFIAACKIYYNLEVLRSPLTIKEALDDVLRRKPNLKACFMGTRSTDPYSSELNVFQMTDPMWPQVMRVSPLLEWRFTDIWDYLLFYKVPYCKLYDLGYTSLGNASNTIKNPSLLCNDVKSGQKVYLPAYKMLNEAEERNGRDVHK